MSPEEIEELLVRVKNHKRAFGVGGAAAAAPAAVDDDRILPVIEIVGYSAVQVLNQAILLLNDFLLMRSVLRFQSL